MYKLCKSEQSAARQRLLEQGLLDAMQQQSYEDISISDLCDRMGVPRKSFYRYFSNKDGALMALLDHTLMEFSPEDGFVEEDNRTPVDLEQFFLFWESHRGLLEALLRSRLSGLLVERATNHAIREKLMPAYLLQKDEKSQQFALTFITCGLLALVLQWHRDGYRVPACQMAREAAAMLSQPLVPGWKRN